jgi:hypothetical protein
MAGEPDTGLRQAAQRNARAASGTAIVNCPECDVEPGFRHDTFCSIATCVRGEPWLDCARANGKKHGIGTWESDVIDEPPVPPADFAGIKPCNECSAPAPRQSDYGWLACRHQILIAERNAA